jgi:hypothetical protein
MSILAVSAYIAGIKLQEQDNDARTKNCTGIYKVVSFPTAFGPAKRCVSIVQFKGPSLPLKP